MERKKYLLFALISTFSLSESSESLMTIRFGLYFDGKRGPASTSLECQRDELGLFSPEFSLSTKRQASQNNFG